MPSARIQDALSKAVMAKAATDQQAANICITVTQSPSVIFVRTAGLREPAVYESDFETPLAAILHWGKSI